MKVICIDDKPNGNSNKEAKIFLVEGRIYTVVGECYGDFIDGIKIGYELSEDNREQVYAKERFVPLSEIDEMELVNEKEVYESNNKHYGKKH